MPDLQTALRSRIVTAVGHSRVYWTLVPQGASRPYVRMQTISDPRPEHLTGYDGARITRVQVDVFAEKYSEARAASETIIAAVANPATVSGIKFGRTKAEGPRDLGEDVEGVGYVHRLSLDLLAEHSLA
ncbi:tail completion protein gp17 [Qipengyuania huizhouensis]|uniref:tail completion protein gp17 n=1 Tax=Qipengyuania huizhouensis TaxID=2867245 RepID=UPI001C86BB1C|nr:DUF3168 domain-containing protein [Qipengyuania huizhouensis]MBX7459555.1 DUF3168 domain-containing protein [Qipengyuania huizhouensis]